MVAHSTPRVDGITLVDRDDAASSLTVGSPAWYAWLEDATTFAFASAQGRFTARKERSGQTGWYWKAYRKHQGTLHRVYLGKSADLSLDRLNAVARELAQRALEAPSHQARTVAGPAPAPAHGDDPPLTSPSLPTGTLTFCFTDIEASTQLWEQHPQTMRVALARHDAILRQAIETQRGVVFKMVGDGVYAVFARAADALAAALAAQRGLQAADWGELGCLRVRMALHTGAAELRDGDYFGGPLNRLARILALGHGGQVLLSHTTHDLVADDLPELRAATLGPMPEPSQPLHLLTTKLYVPPARPQLVTRPRLLARLEAGLSGKLTLLCAPAGFGKTTLVCAWRATAAGSAVPVAWVSLDA